jgi:hypothetical protein
VATGNEEVRVPLKVPVETNSAEAATSVDQLRDRIDAAKNAIREQSNALRSLKGKSEDVTKAKDQLKAQTEALREEVSAATLELLKQGTSYDKLAEEAKKAKAAQDEANAAQEKARAEAEAAAAAAAKQAKAAEEKARAEAEAVAKTKAKAEATREEKRATDAAKFSTDSYVQSAEMMGTAMTATAAAAVALTTVLVAGLVALGKWIVTSQDAARSMSLVREAATGSAANAKALGEQIDALGDKVPTSKEALNALAVDLSRAGVQGQALVDTFNAVGQAASAMGDQAGSTLRGLVERGRISQVFSVSPQELQGTGVAFDDLAKEIAAKMKVGVNDARAALFEGRVKLADGAAAMRAAVEKKFGDINLRKMLTLGGLAETVRKKLAGLSAGVDIERGLRPLGKLVGLLDESSFVGSTLKRTVTAIGTGMVDAFEKSVPMVEKFIKGLIIGGLQVYVAYLKVKKAVGGAFGDVSLFKNLDMVQLGVTTAKAAIVGLTVALGLMAAVTVVAFAPFVFVGKHLAKLAAGFVDLVKVIASIDWSGSARAMIDGLVRGLTEGASRVAGAVGAIAEDVKTRFKNALGIRSPSKVFAEYGENITAGLEKGVDAGSPDAQAAVSGIVGAPKAGGAGLGGGGGGSFQFTANLYLQAGPGDAPKALEDPQLKAQLEKMLHDAATAAGIRVAA